MYVCVSVMFLCEHVCMLTMSMHVSAIGQVWVALPSSLLRALPSQELTQQSAPVVGGMCWE